MSAQRRFQTRAKKGVGPSGVTARKLPPYAPSDAPETTALSRHDILDVADTCEFEEIAYLLVHGTLPTRASFGVYKAKLKTLRGLPMA